MDESGPGHLALVNACLVRNRAGGFIKLSIDSQIRWRPDQANPGAFWRVSPPPPGRKKVVYYNYAH